MALSSVRQKLGGVATSVRQAFSSEGFERQQTMAKIAEQMTHWNIKSTGESAMDLAQLAGRVAMYAGRGEALPKELAFDSFVALYTLALPKLRYDSGAYWNRPGDEKEAGSDGKLTEKDCSKFHVGDMEVTASGKPFSSDFKLTTRFVDHSMPYRQALQDMIGGNMPSVGERKHAIFHHLFNSMGWHDGYMAGIANPALSRKMAEILTKAARAKAKSYFGGVALEKDLLEQSGAKAVGTPWSRALQFTDYGNIYCIRSVPHELARVESLHVLQGSDVERIMRQGLKDWQGEASAASELNRAELVNSR